MIPTASYHYQLTLTLKTPFLSKKVGAQQFGYDSSMLKGADNYPVFLGSQIRGNLRHALQQFQKLLEEQNKQPEKLAELKQVLNLFGDKSKPDKSGEEGFKPDRANLNFAYYWQLSETYKKEIVKEKIANDEPRYRIGIEPQTGAVKPGNLQVIESVFKSGLSVDFCGVITAQLTKDEAETAERWLRKAAQFIPAIGALKGTGFGKVESAKLESIDDAKEAEIKKTISTDKNGRFGIVLKLDRPFCIAQAHLPNTNRFVSREFIAGNILLGAIARQYPLKDEEKIWFNKIRITHALPAPKDYPCRPTVLPLSLAFFGDKLVDLALINPHEHVFLYQQDGKFIAPEFQPDWKNERFTLAKQTVMDRTGSPLKDCQSSFQRQLVVHTAIKEGTNQAEEGKLFSLECIDPKQDVWCADVDLSALKNDERKQAIDLLQRVINQGLSGIGKTKARATFALRESFTKESSISALDDKYVITLQTDARLFAPHPIQATNGQQNLHQRYADYWHHVSDGKLTLSHYYAQQTRVGGQFHWRYYQKNQPYEPQWVTKAGSVFVLEKTEKATESEIQALLTNWQMHGLPQAEDKKDSTWEDNPLIRQNGYGEVLINAKVHVHKELKVNESEGEWL